MMCFVDMFILMIFDVKLDAFVFYETKIDVLPLSKTGLITLMMCVPILIIDIIS